MNPATSAGIDTENPWPGLSPFDEAAQAFFSGRDAESAELDRLVGQAPLTVLFGGSGLGKTSLLQAGLFPRLRLKKVLPVHLRLDMRDRAAPLMQQVATALRGEIERQGVDAGEPQAGETLWEYLHRAGMQWWSRRNQPLVPLLAFDQFEEVFTLGSDNPQGIVGFRLDLADLIENRIPADLAARLEAGGVTDHLDLRSQRYKVLLSFREDFLPEVEGWKTTLPSLMRNRLRLLPMGADQAFQVASGRTALGETHALVSGETARGIVRFVAAAQSADRGVAGVRHVVGTAATEWDGLEIEPALLSLVCAGLNEKRKARGQATIDAALLEQTGAAIIVDFYERCVADVPQKTRRFVEDALITEGGFRNSYPLQDALDQGQLTQDLLRRLVDRRLLRIDHQLGADRVELIHDRLTGVVREQRGQQRERLRARRQRRMLWAAAAAFVVVCAVGLLLFGLWQNARTQTVRAVLAQLQAEAGQLATRSRAVVDRQIPAAADAGLLLGAAAHRKSATNDTYGALQYALEALPRGLSRLVVLPQQVSALSADGSMAVTTTGGSVRLWDVASGKARGAALPADGHTVTSAAFSADCRLLAVGTRVGNLVVWDVASGRQRGATLSEDWMRGWEPVDRLHPPTRTAKTVALSPDGTTLASGHSGGVLRLWNLASGQSLPLEGHRLDVESLAFSPDGKTLASGSLDNTVRLWNVASGQSLGAPLTGHPSTVKLVEFSPYGLLLASASDARILLSKTADPKATPEQIVTEGVLSSMAFSPDGRWLATGGEDGAVRLWDVASGRERDGPLPGHGGEVTALAFGAHGKTLVAASADKALRVWELAPARPDEVALEGEMLGIRRVALSPDGGTLATGGADGSVRFWEAATGQPRGPARQGHLRMVTSIVLSSDGKLVATGGHDGTLRIWDAATGEPRAVPLQGHKYPVESLAFSPDGTMLASGSYVDNLRLWDVTTEQPRGAVLKGHTAGVTALAFSPDGRTLASGSEDYTLRLWDAATGQPRGGPRTGHSGRITTIAFSPDGELLVSGSADMTLCPWYVASETLTCTPLKGHRHVVTQVVFNRLGTTYVSASADGTLRFWANARPRGGPLQVGANEVRSVSFVNDDSTFPTERQVVSVDSANKLRRRDTPDAWLDRVCSIVARNLSRTEWDELAGGNMRYVEQCPGFPSSQN